MKLKLLFSIVFFLPAGYAFSQSSSAQEQVCLDLSKRKFEWFISKQYDSLDKVLDDRLHYIHSNGLVQSKKEFLDDLRSGKTNYQKVTVKESGFASLPPEVAEKCFNDNSGGWEYMMDRLEKLVNQN